MTFPIARIGFVLVACFAALTGTEVFSTGVTAPQSPSPQQVFRAGTTLVRVDAYPRRDGRIVEELTAKDFQVFENGTLQVVETFEFVKIPPHTPDADLRDPTSVADMNRQAADPRNRIFVIYLDPYNTTMFDSTRVRAPLMDFLTRVMGPSDLFGLMTPEIPVSGLTLGRRFETVSAILATPWGLDENPAETLPRNAVEERVYACFGPDALPGYRRHLLFASLESLIPYLGSLRDERKNLILVTGAFRVAAGGRGAAMGGSTPLGPGAFPPGRGGIPQVGVGPGGQLGIGGAERREGSRDTSACEALAASMNGRSAWERFTNILESARNANVSIYPIDTGGLRITDAGITDTLRTMAENTNGSVVVNTNDLGAGMRRIADELSGYYLLSYYSTNNKDDGLFRRIEVKTTLRDVDVSARRGYFAPTEAMRKAEMAARARPRTAPSPAVEAVGLLSRLRPEARVYAHGVASESGLDVAVEIASREIEAGRWRDGADVSVSVSGPAFAPTSVSARIEAGTRGVLVRVPMTLAADADSVSVVATITSGDLRDEAAVDITRAAARIVEAPVVFRATPSPRSVLRPVAELQFRRIERLHLEWAIVGAPAQRTARLLNAQGQAIDMSIALADRTESGATTIAADVLLTAIPAGDYVIELVAERDGVSETRLTAFRLVR